MTSRIPPYILHARDRWQHARRPDGIETPGPGQESVWDYPRPPVVEPTARHLAVDFAGRRIAETRRGLRLLETSHPPTYYFPPEDVNNEFMKPSDTTSVCPWKGTARYYHVEVDGSPNSDAAWYYPDPTEAAAHIKDHVAFWKGIKIEE